MGLCCSDFCRTVFLICLYNQNSSEIKIVFILFTFTSLEIGLIVFIIVKIWCMFKNPSLFYCFSTNSFLWVDKRACIFPVNTYLFWKWFNMAGHLSFPRRVTNISTDFLVRLKTGCKYISWGLLVFQTTDDKSASLLNVLLSYNCAYISWINIFDALQTVGGYISSITFFS